jgi:sulfide dehydrogenase cytochrome subunit
MRLPALPRWLLLLALFAGPASAADRMEAGMRLAATCANCHGTNGVAVGTEFASLAGWPRRDMLAAMQDFRSGKRTATVMHQLAKGYNDEELNLLADYFSARQRPPKK